MVIGTTLATRITGAVTAWAVLLVVLGLAA